MTGTRSGDEGRPYMGQLDGLRFLAIVAVMVQHNWRPRPLPWIFARLDYAEMGVLLFFVLSGFLITGILLGGRDLVDLGAATRLRVVRIFYVRRFLRIFPVYYLTLAVVVAAGLHPTRRIWPWLFSYTTNIYIWHHLHWIGHVGHFWTLAVEEQFYLLWPWLLLFLPRRLLVPVLAALIALAPVYRLYATYRYPVDMHGDRTAATLTLAPLDSLGAGALLAVAMHAAPDRRRVLSTLWRLVLPTGVVGYLVLLGALHYGNGERVPIVLDATAVTLVSCWLVGVASIGFRGAFGRFLGWRPVASLGKISYGIYVFHFIVPAGFAAVAAKVGAGYDDRGPLNFVLTSLATIALAVVSWHLFEGPLNGLKRNFRYVDRRAEPAPVLVPAA